MAEQDGLSSPQQEALNNADEQVEGAAGRIERRRACAVGGVDGASAIRINGAWESLADAKAAKHFIERTPLTGFALSGGGIRSATLSLGLIEALASRGRFYAFDFMSTVSGGGYCGSFVRSLFIKRDGNAPMVVTDRIAFADATLTSLPDQQFFRSSAEHRNFLVTGKTVKNPLWWLRENGRYLAPGGMSGYGYAISYNVRNWVTSVIYILAVTMVAFGAIQALLYGLVKLARLGWQDRVDSWLTGSHLSPLLPLLVFLGLVGTGIGSAYWLSIPLPYARPFRTVPGDRARAVVAKIVLLLLALFVLVFVLFL